MTHEVSITGRINILPVSLSMKIAAGEVIDKPQAVVRELLDNSIDAQAQHLEVFLSAGGVDEIVVQDDGSGISFDDLSRCALTHATSKISTESDLAAIHTRGFRGEALCSISQVSNLRILSSDGNSGGQLHFRFGERKALEPASPKKGTRIEVRELFGNMPARKKYLKRAGSEYSSCKNELIDKALSAPATEFRLYADGKLDLYLAQRPDRLGVVESLQLRYQDVLEHQHRERFLVRSIEAPVEHGSAIAIACDAAHFAHDRRGIKIFVNGRRIQDFSLIKAVELGYAQSMPGGRFPFCAVFLELDPESLDVNIHPAKREIRMQDVSTIQSQVHRMISRAVRSWGTSSVLSPVEHVDSGSELFVAEKSHTAPSGAMVHHDREFRVSSQAISAAEPARTWVRPPQQAAARIPTQVQYLGQIFGFFLAARIGSALYLVDMHAAHERILFDRMRTNPKPQRLIVPMSIGMEAEDWRAFEKKRESLERVGIVGERNGDKLTLTVLPSEFAFNMGNLEELIRQALYDDRDCSYALYAQRACKAAIKDGEVLGAADAIKLIQEALELPEPRCPHGRPVFLKWDEETLRQLIGRSV